MMQMSTVRIYVTPYPRRHVCPVTTKVDINLGLDTPTYHISSIKCCGYYFFVAHFGIATIPGRHYFIEKLTDINDELDKVHTSNTVTTVR